MNSIYRFLESLPEYEAMKKPFSDKIDSLESQKGSLEEEIEELESQIDDLDDDICEQEKEMGKINAQVKEAYLRSLRDPKNIIIQSLARRINQGDFSTIKIEFPSEDTEIILSVPMKRITVVLSFPSMAKTDKDYGELHVTIAPHNSTQPWQIQQLIKMMKQEFIRGMRRVSGEFHFSLLVPLEKMSEYIEAKLEVLSNLAESLDGPLSYSFDSKEDF